MIICFVAKILCKKSNIPSIKVRLGFFQINTLILWKCAFVSVHVYNTKREDKG